MNLLKQIIAIHYEQAKRQKAIRLLSKVEWSFDFLSEVVRYAAKNLEKDIEITIESKYGHKIKISSVKDRRDYLATDDDIFCHLDDQAAVERFIREHSRR